MALLLKLCTRTLHFHKQLDSHHNTRILKFLLIFSPRCILKVATERRSPTSFKVKHLQYYIEGVLFAVTFTKKNFHPISWTDNMGLWRIWDLCANIHTSTSIEMLQCNLKYHLNIAYNLFDRSLGCVKLNWI